MLKIHRHCFTGDVNEYQQWKSAFPNCKFGISPLIFRKREHFKKLFQEVPLEDLLLESDAPYITREHGGLGEPTLVKKVAVEIADLYGVPVKHVEKITSQTAAWIYSL
ncbi:deoxyribonuclease YabD [Mizuhopecten yessoensis]|uniref:Deoxyribonuclease YabD n=1 Tax=Mizuhopecten yessoensis TaxID=6573 RepID=A0A210R3M4_MIZYE|nr:deoxyribonuclease YabD [Mizuhopecten yessoensis]